MSRSSSGEDPNEFSVSFEQLDFISLQSRRGGISGGTGTRELAEAVKDHLAMGRGEVCAAGLGLVVLQYT